MTKIYINLILFFTSFTLILSCSKNDSSENKSCGGTALSLKNTSYENFKEIDLTPQNHPNGVGRDAVAYADFNQDGLLDMFVATLTYWPPTTQEAATGSNFDFYIKNCDGDFEKNNGYFSSSDTCIHPRKALVNDYNNDNLPDVFIICHGWDKNPYPGEKNKVLLSKSLGSYDLKDASSDVGFFHSGSSYDYNNDGHKDVILVNSSVNEKVRFYKNQGDGTFVNDNLSSREPTSVSGKSIYTIEMFDINGDSKLDMLLGGHEWSSNTNTQIYLNPGNDNFSSVNPDNITAITNEGVVLDFTVTKNNSTTNIWVLRTSGGDGTFYQSRTIQKVSWPSLNSSTPVLDRSLNWIPWIIPSVIDGKNVITSDNKDNYFTLEY